MSVTQEATTSKYDEEQTAMLIVINSFAHYREWARNEILIPKTLKYDCLDEQEKQLLVWFPNYLQQLEHSININADFFDMVIKSVEPFWGPIKPDTFYNDSNTDFFNVIGLMSQFVREWSNENITERELSFGKILKTAEKYFPSVNERPNVEVLIPGSGLGRLLIEFARRGFKTQGNEISYHMLLGSHFLMNNSFCTNNFFICPFIHKNSNVIKRNYQCRQIYFPDFNSEDIYRLEKEYPSIPMDDLMTMIAGEFVDLYGPPNENKISEMTTNDPIAMNFRSNMQGKFMIVATCFFIDTANDIISYLKTIYHCLNDNGYWINFGPLLWHHENSDKVYERQELDRNNGFTNKKVPLRGLELSLDDLISLINNIGFEFVEHESNITTSYGADVKSMAGWNYNCEFWVCRKKLQN